MTQKMHRQFETDLDVQATIDAITAGTFTGALIDGVIRYSDFKAPGFFSRVMEDGRKIHKGKHPDHRIATKIYTDVEAPATLVAFTPDQLSAMFSKGMVVENGPGHNEAANFRMKLAEERKANPTEYEVFIQKVRAEALESVDDEKRALLQEVFDLADRRHVHIDEESVRNLASSSVDQIQRAGQEIGSTPYLAYLKVPAPEESVPAPTM